jgi:DNA polymerase III epsilon subunit family exonuclease
MERKISLLNRLRDIPLVFIDVETNGMSAAWGSRVIEIGVVRIEAGVIVSQYEQLIDPRRRISPTITAMTGITPAMCLGQPTFAQQLPKLLGHLVEAIVVGHNIRFDLSFLTHEFDRAHRPIHDSVGRAIVVDTLRIARKRFGRGGNGLGRLAERLGVEPTGEHRALADALTTFRVFEKLIETVGGWDLTLADLLTHQGNVMRIGPPRERTRRLKLSDESRVLSTIGGREIERGSDSDFSS